MKIQTFSKLLVLISAVLIMPTTVMAESYKIGVVNAVKVLEAAPQAEQAKKRLEKEFAARDKKLVAAQKAVKVKEDKLAKDGAIMSESELKKLQKQTLSARRELKRDQDEFRDDLNFRRNEEFGKIQRQIVQAIQKIAKDGKYDLIVGEGVIFASPKVDITKKVIEQLKKGK